MFRISGMEKSEAIKSLGGTVKVAAAMVGVSEAAVYMWPDPLPDRIRDRVQAALWRREQSLKQVARHAEGIASVADAAPNGEAHAASGQLDSAQGGEAVAGHGANVGAAPAAVHQSAAEAL